MLNKNNLKDEHLNVTKALRIFVCTFTTNCSAESFFSSLKRIKPYLRSITGTENQFDCSFTRRIKNAL